MASHRVSKPTRMTGDAGIAMGHWGGYRTPRTHWSGCAMSHSVRWMVVCLALLGVGLQACESGDPATDEKNALDDGMIDSGDVSAIVDLGSDTESVDFDAVRDDLGTSTHDGSQDDPSISDVPSIDGAVTDSFGELAPLGAACTVARDCATGLCATGLPGGYCSAECGYQDCPESGVCTDTGVGRMCWKPCVSHEDCRADYACIPTEQPHCVPRGDTPVYGTCSDSGNCDGTGCLHLACGADQHKCQIGTCTLACSDTTTCPGTGKCADLGGGFLYCFIPCESSWDCEIYETCSTAANGKYCRPNSL